MLIAEVERQSGLSRDTIRYYERIGLLPPTPRSSNGYRAYEPHTLIVLSFIRSAQQIGFTLEQVRAALPHLRHPPERCEELLGALRAKRENILEQIASEQARLRQVDKLLLRWEPLP
ncbi:MAG: MerR family transcriptional regulator [Pseudomonas sp.]|uniref:MerR family transcriptional regulator n=1 Tax=Pseudomonas sp. TaxID=306 RepID=UPI00273399DF|nr:MerR family transcriptional regulator [Pseudomonas sp.]MDP3848178.1 MerR family transcriptional regulator [Pseudomonas sp.]